MVVELSTLFITCPILTHLYNNEIDKDIQLFMYLSFIKAYCDNLNQGPLSITFYVVMKNVSSQHFHKSVPKPVSKKITFSENK